MAIPSQKMLCMNQNYFGHAGQIDWRPPFFFLPKNPGFCHMEFLQATGEIGIVRTLVGQ